MNGKEKEKLFYISHNIELLFWLVVILFIVGACSMLIIHNKKTDNDYAIFLPDVDGLIVGSPVRMMGIQIGHVLKIKPVNNEVYVKFLINDKNISIPQGTQATVEFSGMAGSKSLELYPPGPDTYIDSSMPLLQVTNPKRLSDAIGLLNEMFHKFGSIITTASRFGRHLKEMEMPIGGNSENLNDFLKYSDELIDVQTKRINCMEKRMKINGK